MTIVIYITAVASFCAAFQFSRILGTTYRILHIAGESSAVVMDKTLDDHAKEVRVQKAAIEMLKTGFFFTVKAVFCLAAAVAPLWFADFMSWAEIVETSAFALRIDVLIITTVAVVLLFAVTRRLTRRDP